MACASAFCATASLSAPPSSPARLSAAAPLGLPSFTPRALAAASASFVRREIASRSYCATSAMMPTVRSLAPGISQATNLTPLDCRVSRKAALRLRRSSLAMTSVAPVRRARLRALSSSGRSSRPPLSTSVNRARTWASRSRAKVSMAARCASSPSPDRPCWVVETRSWAASF